MVSGNDEQIISQFQAHLLHSDLEKKKNLYFQGTYASWE